MKLPLLIFVLHVSYSASQINEPKKIFVKNLPKKVHPGLHRYDAAFKYLKAEPTREQGYTVFSKIFPEQTGPGGERLLVPDSPYFPVDTPLPGQQIRVKKVLSDYGVRLKRSADGNEAPTEPSPEPQTKKRGGKRKKRVPKHHKEHKKRLRVAGDAENTNSPKVIKKHSHHKHTKRPRGKKGRNKKKPKKDKKGKKRDERVMRRLIAGRDALIEQYPYVVSIQKDGQHWCAGAILNPRLVITTANCMWKSKHLSRMRIRAGSRHTDRGGQTAKIQEVMKHPGWKIRKNPDNDVALLLLDRNIKFSHSVHAVDLPNRVMLPAFDDAWITSWGAERRDGVFDPRGMSLQVYHARLMSQDSCNNVTKRFGVVVTENFFCLAQTARRAPCTRDTGAPAVSDGVLWGLASWGIRKLCGTERFPSMFSYLASHSNMDFITSASSRLQADHRQQPFPDRYERR